MTTFRSNLKATSRVLARLTKMAVRASDELAGARRSAEALSLEIQRQLNNAIEELDLLLFYLHEATLLLVVAKSGAQDGDKQ
jgi:hypothetical protein